MSKGIKIRLWGDYALFSRPEAKVERYTYDVITPSAARGIMDSIFWHPGLRWEVDKIHVMKPIRFTSVRRNEVTSKILAGNLLQEYNGSTKDFYISTKANIVQRASVILRDVEYVIELHFDMTDKANSSDNPSKFKDMAVRRLKNGACYSTPYFGCREFPANFELFEDDEIKTAYEDVPEKDLGLMLYDMDYTADTPQPMFFRARMNRGTLDLRNCEVIR